MTRLSQCDRIAALTGRVVVDPATGCWIWPGATTKGYGRCTVEMQQWLVHRFLYTQLVSDIPDRQLHHKCGVPACVNPGHLEPVTPGEHHARHGLPAPFADKIRQRAEQTHCKRGHPLDGDNVRLKPTRHGRGFQRVCRTCHRQGAARRYQHLGVLGEHASPALPDGVGDMLAEGAAAGTPLPEDQPATGPPPPAAPSQLTLEAAA